MTEERRQITGHILACGTQIMWGATFVSTKVLLNYFLPAEVLFTRAVLAFLALLIFYPHHLKLKNPRQELAFAGANQVKRSFAGGMYTAGNDSHPADI